MGAAAAKLKKKGTGKTDANQDGATSGNGITDMLGGLDTNKIAAEVGKNLTEKSGAISEAVADNLKTTLSLTDDKKEVAKKGIDSALKAVGDKLSHVTDTAPETEPSSKPDEIPSATDKPVAPDLSSSNGVGLLMSQVAKGLTDNKQKITDTVTTNLASQMSLSKDQTEMAKKGVETALDQVSSFAAPKEVPAKETSTTTTKDSQPSTTAPTLFGLDTAKLSSEIGKNLTEKSHDISKTVVSNISSIAPQLKEHKEAAEKAVDSAIKGIGDKLSESKEKMSTSKPDESLPTGGAEDISNVKADDVTSSVGGLLSGMGMGGMGDVSGIASKLGKTLQDQSTTITDTVTNTISDTFGLAADKKESVKSAVESAINVVSGKLTNEGDKKVEEEKDENQETDQKNDDNDESKDVDPVSDEVQKNSENNESNGASKEASNGSVKEEQLVPESTKEPESEENSESKSNEVKKSDETTTEDSLDKEDENLLSNNGNQDVVAN